MPGLRGGRHFNLRGEEARGHFHLQFINVKTRTGAS